MSVSVKFSLPAPKDAPETRASNGYFRPEHLVWTVSEKMTFVQAEGFSSRAGHRRLATGWVMDGRWPDEVPFWVKEAAPQDLIAMAREMVDTVHVLSSQDDE